MNDLRSDPVWKKLHSILSGLPMSGELGYLIPSFVDTLTIVSHDKTDVDRHYVQAGHESARKDLDSILRASSLLIEAMKDVRREVYDLLYDAGVKPYDVIQFCSGISQVCNAIDLGSLPKTTPKSRTRVRADDLANILAFQFEALVGKRATIIRKEGIAGGRFLHLVTEVFSAASIEASPEGCATRALRKRRALNLPPKTPFEAERDGS